MFAAVAVRLRVICVWREMVAGQLEGEEGVWKEKEKERLSC